MKTKNKNLPRPFFNAESSKTITYTGLRIQFLMLADIGKASSCHTERRKTGRDRNELVCHTGLKPIAMTAKNMVFFSNLVA
jgi:hypothetical protein